jgi:hypothetical protein
MIRGKLRAVGLNELLDSVRRDHSASPEPSRLILSFDLPTAVRRFIFIYHRLSMLREAQSIQHESALKKTCDTQDL